METNAWLLSFKRKHFGESNIANSGMKRFIMAYRQSDDIDIVFEDGTILTNKRYKDFTKGRIVNPNIDLGLKKQPKIGEINIATNGQKMMIFACVNSKVDVIFEDGTIVKNQSYSSFKNGHIKNKTMPYKVLIREPGERSMATNGQWMEIIVYRNTDDIDVQFEDGTIVQHKRYDYFKSGQIKNPKCAISKTESTNELAILFYLEKYGFIQAKRGKLKQLGLGNQEIDVYHPFLKVGIEYDGCLHKAERDHRKNQLCKDAGITLIRIRDPKAETLTDNLSTVFSLTDSSVLSLNLEKTLIAVFSHINTVFGLNLNLDINLCRDKYDIYEYINKYHISYRVGQVITNKRNEKVTLIAYRKASDIDVQFENGEILKNKRYSSFKKGEIISTNEKQKIAKENVSHLCSTDFKSSRVGESVTLKNGDIATIIDYINAQNITLLFSDGTIAYNRQYAAFKKGFVHNPSVAENQKKTRTGMCTTNKAGKKMTIIEYITSKNITVQFEDGPIVYNQRYQDFKNGYIKKPAITN